MHSKKEKALIYKGGDLPVSWTLWQMLEVARFLYLTLTFRDNSMNIVSILEFLH